MEQPWPIQVTDEELQEWLDKLQGDPGNDPGDLATLYLIAIGAPAVPRLTPLLTSSTPEMCSRVLRILGGMGPEGKAAAPAVEELLTDSDPKVVTEASGVLLRIAPPQPEALENLLNALDSDNLDLQREAAYSLHWCLQRADDDRDDPTRQCDETRQWLLSQGEYLAERCVKVFAVDYEDGEGVGGQLYRFLGAKAEKAIPALIAEYYRSRDWSVLEAIIATRVDVSSFLQELADSDDERDRHNVAAIAAMED